jgi:hypothetical protein
MSAAFDSPLGMLFDVPLPAIKEKGHGAHIAPSDLPATYMGLAA